MSKEPQNMNGLVAQGPEIIRSSEASSKKMLEICQRVRDCYSAEYAKASWWNKFKIRLKMHRETRKEIGNLAPPHALYINKAGRP
jgi:hypothetical protein